MNAPQPWKTGDRVRWIDHMVTDGASEQTLFRGQVRSPRPDGLTVVDVLHPARAKGRMACIPATELMADPTP